MIELTKNESILLLAIKGNPIMDFPKAQYESDFAYSKRVCGIFCGCTPDYEHWFLELFFKLANAWDTKLTIEKLIRPEFSQTQFEVIYSYLRMRKVTDLIIDKTVIETKGEEII